MPEVITLNANRLLTRALMVALMLLTSIGSWFVVRWYLANSVADYINPDENDIEMARRAVTWAPNDPLTHWRLGQMVQKKLPPDHLPEAVREFEKAAALSPNDYRFWTVLGIALEQVGDGEKGERALRQATQLAPSYASPHWNLGNLLLRNARYDEAFGELRRASAADPSLRPQLFNLAWEVYRQDNESMKNAVGTASEERAEFSHYLVSRERYEDGLRLWQSLSDAERHSNRSAGEAIINTLAKLKRFHQAAEVANSLVPGPVYAVTEGKFIIGGFEDNMIQHPGSLFGWQVGSVPETQVGIDSNVGHSGGRSLRLFFQVRTRLDSIKVSQIILVKPDLQYDFECYVKTDKLQSGATPLIEIVDASAGKVLTGSPSAPTGSTNWERIELSFKTEKTTEAVIVRLARGSCGEDPVCPIFGTVWYDDFNFKSRN